MVNNQYMGPNETKKQVVFGFRPWLSFSLNHESDLTSLRARLTDWTEGAGGEQVFQVESDLEWRPQGKQVPSFEGATARTRAGCGEHTDQLIDSHDQSPSHKLLSVVSKGINPLSAGP